jgi:hypothetical protein
MTEHCIWGFILNFLYEKVFSNVKIKLSNDLFVLDIEDV